MNTTRFLPLALAAALSTTAFAAAAQPIDPATELPADPAVEPAVDLADDRLVDDRDVDRRCLEYTGSRVTADPQPATAKDHTERDGHDCAIGNGTVYTREDIDRSGATTVKEALQALDPRVF